MIRFPFSKIGLVMLLILAGGIGLMRYTAPNRPALSYPEKAIRDTMAPLQGGVTSISRGITGIFTRWTTFVQMQAELDSLHQQVDNLTAENNRLQEYRLENARLKKLLKFTEQAGSQFQLLPGQVISRDPKNWFHTLTLNVGGKDGVQVNMAVVTDKGLVGRVIAVSDHTAEVLTVVDQDGAVGALVQESRVPGVVEGMPGGAGLLQMIHLPHDAAIQPNQVIVTSGLGGLFPRGLRIGYVTEIIMETSGLMKKAVIKPFVDFNRLEEVLVVLNVQS